MPIWNWLLYLVKGFLPIDGKRVGKIIWLAIWIILALTIYHKIFFQKQNITKIEKVEKQVIYQDCPDKDKFVGIKIWKLGLGLNF